ncbi:MAG TPA: MgtC/SapB family protein [Terriglobia bacterium]|nr:MgtC/SapB family protein [Terriglobia bacterium]
MLPLSVIALRLVVATVLSAIVGIDRERLERAAGLRTHAMVGLGAALFMVLSAFGFHDILGTPNMTLDPSRIAAQIVSGIGFLGAGLIIIRREEVRGLTTAASIWVVAAVGAAAGAGMYLVAVTTAGLALLVLAGLRPVENRFFHHRHAHELSLLLERGVGSVEAIESAVQSMGRQLQRVVVVPSQTGAADRVDIMLAPTTARDLSSLMDHLGRLEGVRQITSDR